MTVSERASEPANRAVYTFGAQLRIANVRFSEEWRIAHRELERNRMVDHPLNDAELRASATPRVITGVPAGN